MEVSPPDPTAPAVVVDGAAGFGRPSRRVSLACLPCRSRHMKCDAKKPLCSRCSIDGVTCVYTQSRRRGGQRTGTGRKALEHRHQTATPPEAFDGQALPTPSSSGSDSNRINRVGFTDYGSATSARSLAGSWDLEAAPSCNASEDINHDLLTSYYNYFHASHSCTLPRESLLKHQSRNPTAFRPIIQVINYIGSLFHPGVDSEARKEVAAKSLRLGGNHSVPWSPHQVQALALYCAAIYGCDELEKATEALQEAIDGALELQMHKSFFADRSGDNDPVLEESWRRTWWQLYMIEGHIAGSTHSFPTRISAVKDVDVLLPCEEAQYESGNIPSPRTLEDYDVREFMPEDDIGFSSFAHVVGLSLSLDLVLHHFKPAASDLASLCAQVDVSLSAWCSLLPREKQSVIDDNGDVDMHLYKAKMMIHTFIVDLHRRLSDLAYSSIESVARCAAPAPPATGGEASPEARRLHTSKALLAIRRLGDLIPMSANITTQSPFIICMIANTMVAHFSACRYLFRGRTLQLERERIRSSMGAIRALGEYWPLGKRTYSEMGIIAREILCLSDKDIPRPQHLAVSRSAQQIQGPSILSPRNNLPAELTSIASPGMNLDICPMFGGFEDISQSVLDAYGDFQFHPMDQSTTAAEDVLQRSLY